MGAVRWAGVFLGSAVVLGAGNVLWGGYRALGPVGVGIQALAIILVALGLFAGALALQSTTRERRSAEILEVGPVDPAPLHWPTRRHRVLLALPFTVLALITIAVGILHITVWNPMAAAPGLTLDEIYAAMAAANEGANAGPMVAVWASFWGIAAMTLPILSGILARFFTARRIVVTGLLLVGATACFHWLAGFSMGMSLADTFVISGGDAAPSGAGIAVVGLVAIVAAIWLRFVPRLFTVASVERTPQ